MPNRLRLLTIILLAVATVGLRSSACAARFEDGNALYSQGKYPQARDAYLADVKAGEWHANLFYNLGNAYFKVGDFGRAVLNYHRARLLTHKHPEATANLALARQRAAARDSGPGWQELAASAFHHRTWAILAAVSAWTGIFTIVWIATRRQFTAGTGLLLATALIVASCSLLAVRFWHQERMGGIIVSPEVDAHSEPADQSVHAGMLTAGTKVRILSQRGEWTYCVLPSKQRGWIPTDSVELVEIGGG